MPFISAALTAIGGALGLVAGAGLATFVAIGKAVVGIGINYLIGKFQADRAKKATKQASGTQFERDYGENVSRKVACGLVGIAGHDCYVNTYGSSNMYLEQIFVFSDYPCDGLSKIWAGGRALTLATVDGKTYTVTTGDYTGLMSFVFYDGTQTTANAGMVANSNPFGRWTNNHIGRGICYLVARLVYDQERLSQFPDFFFEIRGARLYDFRKDSTVGGSGPHRWGDYSTHEFSENPIVIDYNYRRGFAWNDDLFLGMDMDAVDLPVDRYATAANICDEIAGGETRYRCSVVLDADVDHGDNIEAVMVSCGGMVVDSVEGSWPIVGTEQPIVETFTDDDLVTTEPVRFQRRRSMADLTNSVGGTYPEPANMWSPAGYDTQSNPTQVALDRRTRDVPLNFGTVRSKRQANQLASIYYNENRYEATADVVLRPRFQTIKIGDWVRWNSARYGDRTFMVSSRSIKALTGEGPRNVALSLQERDGEIYASVGLVPPNVPIPNGEPVYLNALQDWAVIPVIATGADGLTYPAFRMTWAPIDDVTVTGVIFEWWIKTEPANKFTRQVDRQSAVTFIQEGVTGLTDYEFRHRLIADRVTNWTAPITVTSPDAGNPDIEVGLGNLRADVMAVFSELYSSLNRNETLLARLQQNLQINGGVSQTLGRKLQQLGASFTEEVAIITSDIANVVAVTEELIAEFGNNLANGKIAFQAVAAPEGVTVRYAVLLKAEIEDEFKESGFFIELYTDEGVIKSRTAFNVDQFVVTDGGDASYPMVFENGELKLNIANIGTVNAGIIQSPNGKMVVDVNNGTIVISS